MKTLELEKPEILSHLEDMTEEEFVDWYDEEVKAEYRRFRAGIILPFAVIPLVFLGACSKAYFGAMEKVGIHKRDILVDRLEDARDAQSDAQDQFRSALERFSLVVNIGDSDLKTAYEKLNSEYEDSEKAAGHLKEFRRRWD